MLAVLLLGQDAGATRMFTELGAGRGLDANVAVSMLVDRDGLLWVGSREGLFRYDGYQATAFLPDADRPGSVSDLDIRWLYESSDGALWVSTNTGGLNRRDPRTGEFTQFHHDSADPRSLSDASVYGVAEDAEGRIWAGTQHGLNRLEADGRSFTRFFHTDGDAASLAHDWVYAVHRGLSGHLWIGTVGGGIDRPAASGEGFEHFPLADCSTASAPYDVFGIHETADGRVWAGTRDGLVVLDPTRRTAERVDLAGDAGSQPLITTMHADRYGRLWIGTLAHGVLVVDLALGNGGVAHPGSIGGAGNLPAHRSSASQRRSHAVVGTWGSGVFRAPLEEPECGCSPSPDGVGLRDKNVTAVMGHVTAGQPWVGTSAAVHSESTSSPERSSPRHARRRTRSAGSNVLSLAITEDGEHFAGTATGLYRFGPGGESLDDRPTGLDNATNVGPGYIGALLPAGRHGLWVGSSREGLLLRDPGTGRFTSRLDRHESERPAR